MSSLWVPPAVSRRLADSTAQFRADLREQMRFQTPVCAQWSAELQKIDPYLRLGKATEDAHLPGVMPGYYHLVRLNPHAPPWVQPLTDQQGRFIEPTSRMLDDLRASDLQNARVIAERQAREEKALRDAERAKEREDEERREEIAERWKAATETSVSMNRDTPWSQNVAGRHK